MISTSFVGATGAVCGCSAQRACAVKLLESVLRRITQKNAHTLARAQQHTHNTNTVHFAPIFAPGCWFHSLFLSFSCVFCVWSEERARAFACELLLFWPAGWPTHTLLTHPTKWRAAAAAAPVLLARPFPRPLSYLTHTRCGVMMRARGSHTRGERARARACRQNHS